MKPLVGLADLARIFARLGHEHAEELVRPLGLDTLAPAPASPRRPPSPREETAPTPRPPTREEFEQAARTVETQRVAMQEPSSFWRVTRMDPPPKDAPARGRPTPRITDPRIDELPKGSLFDTPPAPPLTAWRHLWPQLREALRTEHVGSEVDVPALLRSWTRGETVREIPRRRRRVWASQASLWIDFSPHLVPLWEDAEFAAKQLRRVLGRRLEIRRLGPRAQRRAGMHPRGWLHGWRADSVKPVLILGDLGLLGGGAAAQWRQSCASLAQRGVRVSALVPWSVRRHPSRAVDGCALLPWEHTRHASAVEPEVPVTRVLTALSAAAFVEPGLLRSLRWLFPDASVETELRAWSHAAVLAADAGGMLLRPEARMEFIARLHALPAKVATMIGEVIRRWHAGQVQELRHAEALTWHEVGPESEASERAFHDAKRFLERFAAALSRGSIDDARAWKHYGRALLEAAPRSAYDSVPELVEIWDVAFDGMDSAAPPEGVDVATVRARRKGGRSSVHWSLRQVGGTLRAQPEDEARWPSDRVAPGSPIAVLTTHDDTVLLHTEHGDAQRRLGAHRVLTLPRQGTLSIETAHGRVHLAPEPRPAWASAMGHDAYGLWVQVPVGTVSFRMRWIPPGRFMMGSPAGEPGRFEAEGPRHGVLLTEGYWLGETPVTQALWESVMGENPSRYRSPDRPVDSVSWDDCRSFLNRLNGVVPGLGLRLPSEAEWEHACRGGTEDATWLGDLEIEGHNNAPLLDGIAWYGGNSGVDYDLAEGSNSSGWPEKQHPHTKAGTRRVGRKAANPYGLFDMLGNVWEWCEDWDGAYSKTSSINPKGPDTGTRRVLRGGSWAAIARRVRAAVRRAYLPGIGGDNVGFRLARGQSAPGTKNEHGGG